jgi:hypothetical protein
VPQADASREAPDFEKLVKLRLNHFTESLVCAC